MWCRDGCFQEQPCVRLRVVAEVAGRSCPHVNQSRTREKLCCANCRSRVSYKSTVEPNTRHERSGTRICVHNSVYVRGQRMTSVLAKLGMLLFGASSAMFTHHWGPRFSLEHKEPRFPSRTGNKGTCHNNSRSFHSRAAPFRPPEKKQYFPSLTAILSRLLRRLSACRMYVRSFSPSSVAPFGVRLHLRFRPPLIGRLQAKARRACIAARILVGAIALRSGWWKLSNAVLAPLTARAAAM